MRKMKKNTLFKELIWWKKFNKTRRSILKKQKKNNCIRSVGWKSKNKTVMTNNQYIKNIFSLFLKIFRSFLNFRENFWFSGKKINFQDNITREIFLEIFTSYLNFPSFVETLHFSFFKMAASGTGPRTDPRGKFKNDNFFDAVL